MRRAEEDYTGLSLGVSLPATLTASVQRKVGLVVFSTYPQYTNTHLGWTPSTFVSSRSDRAKAQAARPEDFMDEEDLAERHTDQKLVSELDQMDILGGTEAEKARRPGVDDGQKECVDSDLLVYPGSPVPQHSYPCARTSHVTCTEGFTRRTYPQEDGLETGSGYRSESDVATTRDSAWA
jgi:hypothetical protein